MKTKHGLLVVLFMVAIATNSFAQDSKQEVLKVVNDFFHTMESKDSVAFNNLFLDNAFAYSVMQQGDSSVVRSSILEAYDSKKILKERLREDEITIHINTNVAAVWAPYDFWLDEEHSHCGYEVFTLIKKDTDWKIASVTYSVEKDSCNK